MPIVFISHGAPSVALETGPYQDALAAFGQTLQPRAIVALSAHWEADLPIQITHRPTNPLIYDFSGFADALYDIHYDAPGSPTTAILVEDLLHRGGW